MAFSFNKAPSASTSLFGGTNTAPSFGAGTNTNTGAPAQTGTGLFGASAPSQGGLFGSSTTQSNAQQSGGLFGSKPAQSGGLFGSQTSQPQQSGGIFGSQGNQPQQGGGLFGSQGNQAQQNGGLFGSQTGQPQQSGGLFGSQTNQPQQSGGLFGSQTNQPQQSGGLFGSQTGQPQQGGGLFGSQASQPQQSGGLFGSQTSQPQQSGSLFGSQPSRTQQSGGGLFGLQPNQPQQGGGLFGSQTQPQPNSLFGQPTSSLNSSASMPANAASNTASQDRKLGAPLHVQLDRIAASWDTSNLGTCQFQVRMSDAHTQYYLYNRAPDAQSLTQLCVRRPDAVGPMHDNLWNKALQENPEPERLYPVLAVGFGDLQVRSNAQKTEASRQLSKAAELSKKLADLHQKHDLSNAVRAHSAMMMQTRIHQRLLSFVKDTSMLIPALRGQSLTAVEDNVKALLENCDAQLNGAMGDYAASSTEHARLRAQMNELWAQLSVVRAKREASQAQGRANGGTEWVVVDESSFDEITHILAALQQGLVHLSNTLTSDSKALDTVCDGLKGVPLVGVRHR